MKTRVILTETQKNIEKKKKELKNNNKDEVTIAKLTS